MENQKLVELLEARDEKALEECKQKYDRFCFRIAHRILGSRENAEEILNGACEQSQALFFLVDRDRTL